jgi:hypothetical protein
LIDHQGTKSTKSTKSTKERQIEPPQAAFNEWQVIGKTGEPTL